MRRNSAHFCAILRKSLTATAYLSRTPPAPETYTITLIPVFGEPDLYVSADGQYAARNSGGIMAQFVAIL